MQISRPLIGECWLLRSAPRRRRPLISSPSARQSKQSSGSQPSKQRCAEGLAAGGCLAGPPFPSGAAPLLQSPAHKAIAFQLQLQ